MTYTKPLLVIVILTTLAKEGQMDNWLANLNRNLNNLQDQIQQSVKNLQRDIKVNVEETVAHVNDVNLKINADIEDAIKKGASTTSVSGVNGGTTILSSPGVSKSITSGTFPNGKPFWYDVEDKVIGTNLYHTERYFTDADKGIQVKSYMLNLSDPSAKHIPVY